MPRRRFPNAATPGVVAVVAVVTTAAARSAAAPLPPHKDGPPLAHTGGFGEPTCRQCHFDNPPDEPGGELVLTGVPRDYAPGRTYRLVVSLARAGMRRAGFQLAARLAVGDSTGRQAGTLATDDAGTAVVRDSVTGVSYLQHTLAGTSVSGESRHWMLRWTAPARSAGRVVFNVAANAANDDDSPFGDYIYTRAVEVRPAR